MKISISKFFLFLGLLVSSISSGQCVYTAPYLQTFDTDTLPTCWSRSTFTSASNFVYQWRFWKNGQPVLINLAYHAQGYAAQQDDHTNNGGHVAFAYPSSSAGYPLELVSPTIDVSNLDTAILGFWMFSRNANNNISVNTLRIDVYNGVTWQLNVGVFTQNHPDWQFKTVELPQNPSDSIKVRFRIAVANTTSADILIDDVFISEKGVCVPPTSAQVVQIGATEATVQVTTPRNLYVYAYGPPGFNPDTAVRHHATQSATLVSGLQPATTYQMYVRDTCGYNPWLEAGIFTTRCAPVLAPFTESFANLNTPTCWGNYMLQGVTADTVRIGNANLMPNSGGINTTTWQLPDHTNANGFFAYADWIAIHNISQHVLELQDVDISGLMQPALSFYAFHKNWAPDSANTALTAQWDSLGTWRTFGHWQNFSGNWQYRYAALPSHAPDTVRLRLIWTHYPRTGFSKGLYIPGDLTDNVVVDDISVGELNSCLPPTITTVQVQNPTSATLSMLGASGTYELEVGLFNFAHGTGTLSQHSGAATSLAGLQPSTLYHVYARNICNGQPSAWSEPMTLNLPCDGNVKTVPFVEGFEAFNLKDSVMSFLCWQNVYTTGYKWRSWHFSTPSLGTGPLRDVNMYGKGKYIYAESDFGSLSDSTFFISPSIDLDTALNPYFTLHYNMYGPSTGRLCVSVESNGTWQPLGTCIIGPQTPYAWQRMAHSLQSFSGQTVRFKIKAVRGTFTSGDIAIDNFRVIDSCGVGAPVAAFVESYDSLTTAGYFISFNSLASNAVKTTWYFGDGASDTGSFVVHAYLANGTYNAYQVVKNECGHIDSTMVVIQINGIGIGEFGLSPTPIVYPNPATQKIHIAKIQAGMVIELYDMQGKKVFSTRAERAVETIGLDALPVGVYMLKIYSRTSVFLERVVVLRD